MHSVMAMDKAGNALTPLIIWADNRSQPVADRLRKTSLSASLHQQTGTPVHAMTPLCKIIWWKEQAPEIFTAATCLADTLLIILPLQLQDCLIFMN
jgi:gluconokinase